MLHARFVVFKICHSLAQFRQHFDCQISIAVSQSVVDVHRGNVFELNPFAAEAYVREDAPEGAGEVVERTGRQLGLYWPFVHARFAIADQLEVGL